MKPSPPPPNAEVLRCAKEGDMAVTWERAGTIPEPPSQHAREASAAHWRSERG